MNVWPSNALREFNDEERVGEPKASQHEVDMTEVEAPSSMTVLCTPRPLEKIARECKLVGSGVYISPCRILLAWNPDSQPHQ